MSNTSSQNSSDNSNKNSNGNSSSKRTRSRTRSRSRSQLNRSSRRSPRRSPQYSRAQVSTERSNPARNNVLAIFGLDRDATEDDLYHMYKKYGCRQCKVIFDKRTGKPRGFGFVYFDNTHDAVKAKHETNGKRILTREIRIDYSIGERDYPSYSSSRRPDPREHRHQDSYSSQSYRSSDQYESRYRDPRGYSPRLSSPPASSHRRRSPSPYRRDSRHDSRRSRSADRYRRSSPARNDYRR